MKLFAGLTVDGKEILPLVETLPFSANGTLTVRTGSSRMPLDGNYVLESVRAMVGTAPTGSAVTVDVNCNGSTIYGTQANRPSIAAGSNSATGGAASVTTFAAGDYLTVDIDAVGSTTPGSDLVVVVRLRRTP